MHKNPSPQEFVVERPGKGIPGHLVGVPCEPSWEAGVVSPVFGLAVVLTLVAGPVLAVVVWVRRQNAIAEVRLCTVERRAEAVAANRRASARLCDSAADLKGLPPK
jgi:hypothetical protein